MSEGDQGLLARGERGPRLTPTRTAAVLAALFVMASVAALMVPIVRAASSSPPEGGPASPTGFLVACMQVTGDDYCQRYAEDLGRRVPLSEAQRIKAEAVRQQVIAALPGSDAGALFCHAPDQRCSFTYTPPTADQVRSALIEAGFRDVVVRTAGANDPAPLGGVLIAVPVGSACVVVIRQSSTDTSNVSGQLPDGRCLAP